MRENVVERYLIKCMKSIGGMCEKHANPGARGDPDRICVFPYTLHAIILVETKWAEGVEPENHQIRRHNKWRMMGVPVEVVRSKQEVRQFMAKRGYVMP